MYFSRPSLRDLILCAAYFVVAAAMLSTTRFDDGVAFLWLGSSLLIPALAGRPRREWGTPMLLCGGASALATGMVGLGWAMAIPLAIINLIEGYLGASLLVRRRAVHNPLGSLGWLSNFVLSVGITAPLTAAVGAGVLLASAGQPFASNMLHFYLGHALGNLTFIPVFSLLFSGELRALVRGLRPAKGVEILILLALVALTTAGAFLSTGLPLLFLPCGPIVLAIFRGRQIGAAMSIVLLALIGGGLTIAGHGPIQMIDASLGVRMQFFQFYLASVVLTVLPIAADLRNRSRLHRELRFSEERHRMLADHSSDILMHSNADGRLRYVSPSIRQLGGYEPADLVGRRPTDFIVGEDWSLVVAEHEAAVASPGETRNFEYRVRTSSGDQRWFETHCKAIVDSGGLVDGVISVVRDISARKAGEQRLAAAAMTDPLTGLPNRRAFWAAAEALYEEGGGSPAGCVAIVDLDHFKRVNDNHGHDGGDAVLCQFAEQGREFLRDRDVLARLGGEEFALLLPGAKIEDALQVCERLRVAVAAMGVPSRTGMIRVTISGGVAALGADGLDAALKNADLALYQAKAGGRDQLALAA